MTNDNKRIITIKKLIRNRIPSRSLRRIEDRSGNDYDLVSYDPNGPRHK